ncbi:MarR family winged helix-turn-helix transcriptional regulator [Enterococcus columbae]|uniref:HTH marR-type domain-containing protein n=1 Tax=Enterococcus columbae DSM 7374 = ATCC 51263 TaxID=1121865 RepID=S1MTX9_9ENTE|nr:MarR family transcriptional regulator [Enterococcus columbae]EOT39608.1 hypothetical protein OMW_01908 [Enterococcus columbae DSM 7374 = ATCC 51263]EOW80135.1 hypothetical protein I568_02214 [Enterococcus columbae DSM 7374 = ATCC 51263]OJG21730.1 hypothetical protein RR47_GL001173 [Enterococcus columbae DSM 7374 = ATCC 51263]
MIQPTIDNQLCFALYRANKTFNRLYNKVLAPFDLTYPQYLTLLALWEEDHQTVSQLGERLALDSGTLTPLIKRLEQRDYVLRSRAKDDERRVIISLTAKAKKLKPTILDTVCNCLSVLTADEANYFSLLQQLNQLSQTLGGMQDEKNV